MVQHGPTLHKNRCRMREAGFVKREAEGALALPCGLPLNERMPSTEYRIPDTEYRVQETGY